MKFCFDRQARPGIGYPNLAQGSAEPFTPAWREFDQHYPQVVPLRLLMYLDWLNINYEVVSVQDATLDTWYPIAFSWFNFELDYLDLVPQHTLEHIRNRRFRILFYYHEADNPRDIKTRIDQLIAKHQLPEDSYCFVSANTASRDLENFLYWPEHELFFGFVNRTQSCPPIPSDRSRDFTVLSRWHKSWRLSIMADLHRTGCLTNSLFSYDTEFSPDPDDQNPIESDSYPDWQSAIKEFVASGPYRCDNLDRKQNNNHHQVNTELYTASRCHIVLETHFDADGSGGTFFTEKTFKCLKYGQPFVIAGPPNSIAELRSMGYRVFDDVIDHGYDNVTNNTERWFSLKESIMQIQRADPKDWIKRCWHDIKHNQEVFETQNRKLVDELSKQLYQLAAT
jgi:hypothetical protein